MENRCEVHAVGNLIVGRCGIELHADDCRHYEESRDVSCDAEGKSLRECLHRCYGARCSNQVAIDENTSPELLAEIAMEEL